MARLLVGLCFVSLTSTLGAQETGIGTDAPSSFAPGRMQLRGPTIPTPPGQPSPTSRHRAAAALARAATAATTATAAAPKETVLYHFTSPKHGAYPATGVIRDEQGNLYGTTNGSYSDIGGGGPTDAGVVFEIDAWGHESTLYAFTGGADGGSPNGLVRDRAGNLYGTATVGGASDAGVVFEVDPSGNETVIYAFSGGADGGAPNGLFRAANGVLYGTTGGGGAAGYGVVFKIDRSGKESVLYSFAGAADGAYPSAAIVVDAQGGVYGATSYGGNAAGYAGAGVVFKIDAAGHESVLYTFTGGNDGAQPNGVLRDSRGDLYGTTSGGGSAASGVVFKLDAAGHETVLHTFSGGNDGAYPSVGLSRDRDGNFYGTTAFGGTAFLGVVFKLDPNGHLTALHECVRGDGGNEPSSAGVTLDESGTAYGTTAFGGTGGIGTVFKIDAAGRHTVLHSFRDDDKGQYPYSGGVILGPEGRLYGTAFYGGPGGAGAVYQLDHRSDDRGEHVHLEVLHSFALLTPESFGQPSTLISDSVGNLFGTTFIGQTQLGFGDGSIFKLDPAGHVTLLHNFTGGADGGSPYAPLHRDSLGNLYGTAVSGGTSNSGVVYKIDTAGNESVLYNFTGGADGAAPYGSLIRDREGNFYGTTNAGGASNAGVVFKLDPSGHETVLYSFTGGNDGGYPLGGLVRDADCNLYGTTGGGGSSGAGVVFKIDSAGHESVLHTFTGGADGGNPLFVTLARDEKGNLFGTTAYGGTANAGVVFKVDPLGNETVLHNFTGGDDGGNPYTGVTLAAEGHLYGTTAFGGRGDVGVVFKIVQ